MNKSENSKNFDQFKDVLLGLDPETLESIKNKISLKAKEKEEQRLAWEQRKIERMLREQELLLKKIEAEERIEQRAKPQVAASRTPSRRSLPYSHQQNKQHKPFSPQNDICTQAKLIVNQEEKMKKIQSEADDLGLDLSSLIDDMKRYQ